MRILNQTIRNLPLFVRNKYFLTFMAFLTWMLFFDDYSVIKRFGDLSELHSQRSKISYYKGQTRLVEADLKDLRTNEKSLEKFAREKYLMKKPDEEIFILVKKK